MSSSLLLSQASVLRIHGTDAAKFLQSQLMNDVSALAIGQWQWTGWLSPKGRVIALGLLLRSNDAVFDWILTDHPALELAPLLRKFVLRSKLSIDVIETLQVIGHLQAQPGDIELGDGRGILLSAPNEAAPIEPDDTGLDHWMAADFRLGLPRLPYPEGVEAHTPHMLSLDRLSAFSIKKGCYPGQEIVARTHFLGSSKRRLLAIGGSGLVQGAPLHADSEGHEERGRIIRSTLDGRHAQAVITGEASSLFHGTVPVQLLEQNDKV